MVVAGLATVSGALLLTLVVCTGLGARRRGCSPVLSVLAGLVFPGMWIAWYVLDGRDVARGSHG